MPSYCLLADLKTYLNISATADDDLLQSLLDTATNRIDLPVQASKNYLKVVSSVGTDTFANGSIAILYRGVSYPVSTAYATEIVTP